MTGRSSCGRSTAHTTGRRSTSIASTKDQVLHQPSVLASFSGCSPHTGHLLLDASVRLHKVNSIAWAPKEFGLCLACASSDETVRVLTRNADDTWDAKLIKAAGNPKAHVTGCNSVSWAPAIAPGALASGGEFVPSMRLVTGGCDNMVKLWRCNSLFTPSPPYDPSPSLCRGCC